ncbi:MAG TPA: prephenate dehydrogenase/arogenate dehydrogenase family protein [Nitrososphaerales archaeon]|nr:prephenate dehydrogenase/arogenate dehydrogenase family protein [Nitrososphaerales archaeon]
MKVAVVGASGGMGSFFVRYFQSRGDAVRGSDVGGGPRPQGTVAFSESNAEAVEGCDVAVLAVPMDRTLKVAREVVPALKKGAVLVEISSVKGETIQAVKKVVGRRASLLSIHPLFGPALESPKGMKIAVITGKKGREAATARALFPDARIIPMGRKEHDKAMAVVLTLTHIVNLAYAGTVARFLSPAEFMRVSTPNSSMQLTLAEAVLAQDSGLSFAIQANNPYSRKVVRAAARELRRVLSMVEDSDGKAFAQNFSRLAKLYGTDRRAKAVVREIYSAAERAA